MNGDDDTKLLLHLIANQLSTQNRMLYILATREDTHIDSQIRKDLFEDLKAENELLADLAKSK